MASIIQTAAYKVSWIIDAKARNEKTVNKVVGYAMILPGAGSKQDPSPKTAPVWVADGSTLEGGKLLYYFQNP